MYGSRLETTISFAPSETRETISARTAAFTIDFLLSYPSLSVWAGQQTSHMGPEKLQPVVVKWDFSLYYLLLPYKGIALKSNPPRATGSRTYRVQRGGPTTNSLRLPYPGFPPPDNSFLPFSPADGRARSLCPAGIPPAW